MGGVIIRLWTHLTTPFNGMPDEEVATALVIMITIIGTFIILFAPPDASERRRPRVSVNVFSTGSRTILEIIDGNMDNNKGEVNDENNVKASREKLELAETCIVCMDFPPQVALFPCGHSNICVACAKKLNNGNSRGRPKCPTCRKPIQQWIKLYS